MRKIKSKSKTKSKSKPKKNLDGEFGVFEKAHKVLSNREHTESKVSDLNLLVSGVAHEFNNILGAAEGHAEWALEEGTLEAAHEALKIVRLACQKSAGITSSLQSFLQPKEEGFSTFSLKDTLNECIRIYKPFCDKFDIKVSSEFLGDSSKRDLFSVFSHRNEVFEILSNLFKNAFEHLRDINTPTKKKSIHIQVTSKAKYFLVEFLDNGEPIKAEFSEAIFKPFFSTKGVISSVSLKDSKTTQGNEANRGLGLYLSLMLAKRLGGDLYLSKPKPPYVKSFCVKIPSSKLT